MRSKKNWIERIKVGMPCMQFPEERKNASLCFTTDKWHFSISSPMTPKLSWHHPRLVYGIEKEKVRKRRRGEERRNKNPTKPGRSFGWLASVSAAYTTHTAPSKWKERIKSFCCSVVVETFYTHTLLSLFSLPALISIIGGLTHFICAFFVKRKIWHEPILSSYCYESYLGAPLCCSLGQSWRLWFKVC